MHIEAEEVLGKTRFSNLPPEMPNIPWDKIISGWESLAQNLKIESNMTDSNQDPSLIQLVTLSRSLNPFKPHFCKGE